MSDSLHDLITMGLSEEDRRSGEGKDVWEWYSNLGETE